MNAEELTITPELVDKVAAALYWRAAAPVPWDRLSESARSDYIGDAKAALHAAGFTSELSPEAFPGAQVRQQRMTSTPRPRVDHLKAGDHAVLLFEGGVRVECDLVTDSAGGLYTADGGLEVLVRRSDGAPNGYLIEVVSPEAPLSEPLPDQQVRIDPDGWAWQKLTTYPDMPSGGSWRTSGPPSYPLTDDKVRDWPVMIREDDPRVMPEGHVAVDLRDVSRLTLFRWPYRLTVRVRDAELARRGESA